MTGEWDGYDYEVSWRQENSKLIWSGVVRRNGELQGNPSGMIEVFVGAASANLKDVVETDVREAIRARIGIGAEKS